MAMVKINSKDELKDFAGKHHLHFCRRCLARLVCGFRERKDCLHPDGVYCGDCRKDMNARKNGKLGA